LVVYLQMQGLASILSNYKIPAAFLLVGLILITSGFLSSVEFREFFGNKKVSYPEKSLVNSREFSEIKIDIAGAVVSSGVYSIKQGSRVQDAILAAGGFSKQANYQYIAKSINLSQKISDGQKLYIPTSSENSVTNIQIASIGSGEINSGLQIGINSADSKQLDELPGIGPVTSAKIIGGRPYSSIDELLSKKIVSKAVFEKIKDQISLN
jgi:competence protein ComEA